MNIERKERSLAKTVSWRIIATAITVAMLYLLTGKVDLSIEGGIAINLIKTVMYFIHERIWSHVAWGVNGIQTVKTIDLRPKDPEKQKSF